jgi:hypothetical protein
MNNKNSKTTTIPKAIQIGLFFILFFVVLIIFLIPLLLITEQDLLITKNNYQILLYISLISSLTFGVVLSGAFIRIYEFKLQDILKFNENTFYGILLILILIVTLVTMARPAILDLVQGPQEYRGRCSIEKSPTTRRVYYMYLTKNHKDRYDRDYFYYLNLEDTVNTVRLKIDKKEFNQLKGIQTDGFKYMCNQEIEIKYLYHYKALLN